MGNKSVLIVEDEEGIRETLRVALELEGYDVRVAANGEEGLSAIEHMHQPGVILLDLMMPVMDGWEFAAAVARTPGLSTVPIVVLSAFADRAQGVPAHSVIRKPLSLDAILDVVGRCCAGSPPEADRPADAERSPKRGAR